MSQKSSTAKKAYYRRGRIQPAHTQTLQQLIAAALSEKPKVKDRLEVLDAAATSFRLIAGHKEINGVQCGTVVTFERGGYQLVVDDDPEATSLIMAAVEPPKNGEKQQQFVPGALFFAVFENHVAVVQSAALRASAFEQHLAWLLRDQTGLIGKNQGLALVDEPKRATVEKIRGSHVKALSIGRPFMETMPSKQFDVVGTDGEVTTQKDTDVSKLRPDSAVVSFIKSFLPDDKFSTLNLENAVFDGDLEVWLEIKYPSRSRSQPQETAKLIDDIAIALRDQDEESVELQLLDGTTVKGADLKISKPLTMYLSAGVPDIDEFYNELAGWLTHLLTHGVVSN